jgi:hypothetical protein
MLFNETASTVQVTHSVKSDRQNKHVWQVEENVRNLSEDTIPTFSWIY